MSVQLERKDGVSIITTTPAVQVHEHELLGAALRGAGLSKADARCIRNDPELTTQATEALAKIAAISDHPLLKARRRS